ncbi:short-chain collagen C4-like [Mytilus trossulus]|uniref:short-chain collagen C4-like n=1 Tax=Mytilus trossulus TaxID=6551 RepID=UPI003005D064
MIEVLYLVYFIICSNLYQFCTSSNINSKRLLLNDPDVINNRLIRLEGIVSMLNASLQQVTTENQKQEQENQQQNQEIHRQNQEILRQNQDIQQQRLTIQTQDKSIQQLSSNTQSSGATYIRWARKQCPGNDTELVYSGYAGGSFYDQYGAAAEYVCLPPDPDFVKTSGGEYGRMFGAEFDSNFFASNSNDEDVPCALCRPKHSASTIMIPGKNTCYPGWKMEYYGYLASGYHSHKAASSFVCVDINPEYIIGGLDSRNGKLFYEVVAKCGSLKCPPYKPDHPLTCVVCTK